MPYHLQLWELNVRSFKRCEQEAEWKVHFHHITCPRRQLLTKFYNPYRLSQGKCLSAIYKTLWAELHLY